MSVMEVYQELKTMAEDTGTGSQERKISRLAQLLTRLDVHGAKYTVRLVTGKSRLGFSDLTILDALSVAKTGDKRDREALEYAFNVWSDMGMVAAVYMQEGLPAILTLDVTPGRPVKPMRAERLGTVTEIVAKLGSFAVEPKFDGMRVQVHAFEKKIQDLPAGKAGSRNKIQEGLFGEAEESVEVKIYSRGLEDITHQFPEVVIAARDLHERVGNFVIDGEAIGVDPATGSFLPFQETIKRKRKHGVAQASETIPLRVYVFDVLYGEERGQLRSPYTVRREVLSRLLQSSEPCNSQSSELVAPPSSGDSGVFVLADSHMVSSVEEASELFDTYMDEKLEGMLCKKLDSLYRAGARDFNWVKYKRAHEASLVDTVDAVVMGYYVGRGKRNKFGMGALLVGIIKRTDSRFKIQDSRNGNDEEQIVTVAKIGTGITDLMFEQLYVQLASQQTKEKDSRYAVEKNMEPDVWVAPTMIVEVQADEITKSPTHTAGYALRFPRLIRVRSDKGLADITTSLEVEQMFTMQGEKVIRNEKLETSN
jgi:DNA ligase-1